jgi:hypothetical protein
MDNDFNSNYYYEYNDKVFVVYSIRFYSSKSPLRVVSERHHYYKLLTLLCFLLL